ncbi:albumin-like [Thomomys bottae]
MKWVTFASLLLLFSSAYSRGVFRRDAHKSEIAHRFTDLGEEHFKALALVAFSQFLQKCPYEHHIELVKEVTDFAKTCAEDESAPNCDKSIATLFGDKVCGLPSLGDHYAELAKCCAKQEPERHECFLEHKDDTPELPPFVRPEPEAMCTSFQENESAFLGHYLHAVATRHPYFYAPELLYYAEKYKEVLTECCQAADKAACLMPKLDALKEKALASSAQQRFKCASIKKFGDRALKAWTVARLSQKFPKADFAEISKLGTDITKVTKECCHGDLFECADDRADLVKYMCENQDLISSKLKECCDLPLLKKAQCIVEVGEDDMPDNLGPLEADFVQDKEVCKNYAEAKDIFLGTFLYECSRRHPDYAVIMLMRLTQKYQATLEKCCAEADPPACYSTAFDELKPLVEEPQNLVKQACQQFEQLGEYKFQNELVIRYTKKTPQVATPTIVDAARTLGKVGTKCCALAETKRLPCFEDYLSLAVNRFCVMHEQNPVSEKVTECCTKSLVNRRPCFSALPVDEDYVPKEFNAETFTFHADFCALPATEQKLKKQMTIAELVKHKPMATEEQLATVIGKVSAFLEKCCKADDKEACFAEDGPKAVDESKAVFA